MKYIHSFVILSSKKILYTFYQLFVANLKLHFRCCSSQIWMKNVARLMAYVTGSSTTYKTSNIFDKFFQVIICVIVFEAFHKYCKDVLQKKKPYAFNRPVAWAEHSPELWMLFSTLIAQNCQCNINRQPFCILFWQMGASEVWQTLKTPTI